MKELIEQAKKTIVFLGRLDEEKQPKPYATGFLVAIQRVFHLVTAKHVVRDPKTGQLIDDGMFVFYNLKEHGKVGARDIGDLKTQLGIDWVFHADDKVDIAIMPFPVAIQTEDVKVIQDELFLSQENLFELYDVFFLSFQPGIIFTKTVSPILRSGTISRINDDRTFYIDASAFPGNSGSPVFLKPLPIRFDSGGIQVGGDKLGGKFIGMIGSYVTYREVAISAQTGRTRVVFEENTGLSEVWSVTCLKEIIESASFLEQLERLKSKKA